MARETVNLTWLYNGMIPVENYPSTDYLCYHPLYANTKIKFNTKATGSNVTLKYSLNKVDWVDAQFNTDITINGPIYLKGNNAGLVYPEYLNVVIDKECYVSGKPSTVTNEDPNATSVSCFDLDGLFYSGSKIIEIKNLIFSNTTGLGGAIFARCNKIREAPTMTITGNADGLFRYCSSLVDASHVTIASASCEHSFEDCESLVNGPICNFPSTIRSLAGMFAGCSSLTSAPDLDNITGVSGGSPVGPFAAMFDGCSSLIHAPKLPNIARLPGSRTYMHMFRNCTNLETLPDMSFITYVPEGDIILEEGWASLTGMFEGCSKIGLYTTSTSEHSTAWIINFSSLENWSSLDMFKDTIGDITGSLLFVKKQTSTPPYEYYYDYTHTYYVK